MTDALQRETMVGVLPLPHPITVRKYNKDRALDLWLSSFQYTLQVLHQGDISPLPLVDISRVRLFTVVNSSSSA